ncbi:siphovirus Gp157 family protein [Alkalicoccobacillus gibsonii]|uniref:siphovirus Gp157 family protein n=1 Tax=Alkalicoccobacillus gibsonii TaxID=79881 RepID=UPI003F7BC31D
MKLYELTQNWQQVMEMIEDGEESYTDTLEAIEEAIEDKAENLAKLIKSTEAQTEVIKAEEKRLADRRKAMENKAKNMKVYLQEQLELAGKTKIKGALLTVAIQKNPPSLNVLDQSLIPQNYFVQLDPQLDKKALLAAIKEGQEIAGAEIKQGESVRIR